MRIRCRCCRTFLLLLFLWKVFAALQFFIQDSPNNMAKMTEVILSEQCSVDSQDSSGSNKIQSNAAEEETKTVDGEVEQLTDESIEEKKDHVSDLAQTMEVQENITTNADSK